MGPTARDAPLPVGPLATNELAVPPEECLGLDQERGPSLAWQESARARHEDAVEPGEPRTLRASSEDRELVAEYRVLDLEGALVRDDLRDPEQSGLTRRQVTCRIPPMDPHRPELIQASYRNDGYRVTGRSGPARAVQYICSPRKSPE